MDYLSHKFRSKYRTVIRCPRCNARFYPTRICRKRLNENGYFDVDCGCGYGYRVKEVKETLIISGKR